MVAVSADKTSLICKCTKVGLQSKRADNLAVNRSTEETISASGRLGSYLYPPCSAGVC